MCLILLRSAEMEHERTGTPQSLEVTYRLADVHCGAFYWTEQGGVTPLVDGIGEMVWGYLAILGLTARRRDIWGGYWHCGCLWLGFWACTWVCLCVWMWVWIWRLATPGRLRYFILFLDGFFSVEELMVSGTAQGPSPLPRSPVQFLLIEYATA